jgi:uncharacterized protein involved in response to NO
MSGENDKASWRWVTLLRAPHRVSFLAGCGMALASALWWWLEMVSRSGAWPSMATAVPATFVHALVMSLGFMPLFFCGFLYTAGPKWLQMPEVAAPEIIKPVVAMGLGWTLVLCGAHWHRALAAAGAGMAALGWLALTLRFIGLLKRSPARDRLHASVVATACSVGVLAMGVATIGLAMADYRIVRLAALLGLWWFVVPVYVAVAHRMIPFFTASALPELDAWRPTWLLAILQGAVILQGVWVLGEGMGWQSSSGVTMARACISALSGLAMLAVALRWGLMQSMHVRLLAMLHVGFAWLGMALCLDAVSTALGLVGHAAMGLLSLHALTMGFLASVLMAMVTRVSCGHSGRPLVADNLVWCLFLALQLTTLLRLVATVWSAQSTWLLPLAASGWLVVMGAWSLRHARWYGLPRVDGGKG